MTGALRCKDVDGVITKFAEQSVMFVLAPPLRFKTGINAPGENGVQEWFDTFAGGLGYEFRELEITNNRTVAFCHSLDHIGGKRTDGTNTNIWGAKRLACGKSPTSTNPCRCIWTAVRRRRLILTRNGRRFSLAVLRVPTRGDRSTDNARKGEA